MAPWAPPRAAVRVMTPRPGLLIRASGALVAAAAAVGLLTGLRAIAGIELPGVVTLLDITTLPRESFGIEWTARASWPADAQQLGLQRLVVTVGALVLSAALVATLNALVLLAEGSAARRSELSVRSAIGATPLRLATQLLGEVRTLLVAAGGLGLLSGLLGGAVLRLTWPGIRLPLAAIPFDLIAVLAALSTLLAAAHLSAAWQVTRRGRAIQVLRSGSRAGVDAFSVFVRNALAATHVATAATVVVGALTLAGAIGEPDPSGGSDEQASDVFVLPVQLAESERSPGAWGQALATVGAVPGVEAESLAAPGALVGLGVRDVAIAECGRCSRGLMPAPLWNALADHHVVAPGYFDLAGVSLLEGRDFAPTDTADTTPVLIVNRRFANTAFEGGRPLGKRVRIGTGFDSWYTVIGIVDDPPRSTLGADGVAREEVYLSALQRPVRRADMIVRGTEEAAAVAAGALASSGVDVTDPVPLEAFRAGLGSTMNWSALVATLVALIACLLALHGVAALSLQITRRTHAELGLRRAVGASDRSVVRHVLLGRLRVTAWGLAGFAFAGTTVTALVQNATGLPGPSLSVWVTVAGAVVIASLAASGRAVHEALVVEPRSLLE